MPNFVSGNIWSFIGFVIIGKPLITFQQSVISGWIVSIIISSFAENGIGTMGTFVISNRLNGDYKFSFATRKGKTVFTSIGFKQKSDCEKFIDAIRADLSRFSITKIRNAGGKYFFRLTKDGFVLATSRKYSTELLLLRGIESVEKYIFNSETLDFSDNAFVFPEEQLADEL